MMFRCFHDQFFVVCIQVLLNSKGHGSAAPGCWCWTIVTRDDGPGNQIRPSMLLPHRHSKSVLQIRVVNWCWNSSDLLACVLTGSLIA